jgi:dimeric dUTPase (all-alpha-NTP-PPase superfamily)
LVGVQERGKKMNLVPLFNAQKILMDRIEKEHPQQENENRFNKRILALYVEVGECANEYRGFKFWSNDQEQRKSTLEELIDVFHFIMDLGLWIGIDATRYDLVEFPEGHNDIDGAFLGLYDSINLFEAYKNFAAYDVLISSFIILGACLGFTWEEIEAAYYEKNKVNHTRQDNDY